MRKKYAKKCAICKRKVRVNFYSNICTKCKKAAALDTKGLS